MTPEQPTPTDRELLGQAAEALWGCAKAALTVEHSLDKPYPDDPRWSPWTRWVERPAREAHDLAMAIRKHLKATPAEPRAAAVTADEYFDAGAQLLAALNERDTAQAELARVTALVGHALDDAGVDDDTKAQWLERAGLEDR